MKTNKWNESVSRTDVRKAFSKVCRACRDKIAAQIRNVRETILAEARETVAVQEHLLRLALNEAEALAWQTACPQLVFPNLAMEKIQGAVGWRSRQRLAA